LGLAAERERQFFWLPDWRGVPDWHLYNDEIHHFHDIHKKNQSECRSVTPSPSSVFSPTIDS
jgi:hypothetical protein